MTYLKKLNIQLVKGEYKNPIKGQVRDPRQIYDVFKDMKDQSVETMLGVYLTDTLEVVTYDVITVGGEDVALVLPHEIFGHVIVTRAKIFILIHNHPKGDPTPSPADLDVIKEIQKGSHELKLTFLDFIIVGDLGRGKMKNYWSMFKEMGGGDYALGGFSGSIMS